MRCLYCGKELALLKRWTRGGEFCSDTHRQRYQEEYNQLAVNRLMQAKLSGENKPAVEAQAAPVPNAPESKLAAAFEPPPISPPRPPPRPAPVRETAWPPLITPLPVSEPQPPPLRTESEGEPLVFLVELPLPVMADLMSIAKPDSDLMHAAPPHLPDRAGGPRPIQLAMVGRVALELSQRATDYGTRISGQPIEARDFVHGPPAVKLGLCAAGKPGLETAGNPRDVLIPAYSPPDAPQLWCEREKEFGVLETELGGLARLTLLTTGLEDDGQVSPVAARTPVIESVPPAQPAPEKKPDPAPVLFTKPLPFTVDAVAAGRAKPVPLVAPGISSGIEVQAPRSSGLPLRPVMILASAPAPPGEAPAPVISAPKKPVQRTVVVKTTPRKPEPAKPDSRVANGKTRAGEPPILPAERKEPPAPYAASDLELRSLSIEASGGFLSRLPAAGKLSVALIAVLAVAGLIAFITKSGGTPASTGPRVVEAGPALSANESGWITDWGADAGMRRQRQFSILRTSLNLTDYRIEFEAQIETKAVGWIYRAKDPKNFYVAKLEIVKPGLNPTVALVRFAVIDGEEQAHAQLPLTIPVRLDTMYKVRFDAVADRFTTWVQDQKIEEWNDARIQLGGVGMYYERGESASVKGGVRVVPLVIKR